MVSSRLLEKRHLETDSESSSGCLEVHSHCGLCHLQIGQAAKILENSIGTMGSVTASSPLTVEANSSGKVWEVEGAVAAQRVDTGFLRMGDHPALVIDSLVRELSEWTARNTPTLLVAKPPCLCPFKTHTLIVPQSPRWKDALNTVQPLRAAGRVPQIHQLLAREQLWPLTRSFSISLVSGSTSMISWSRAETWGQRGEKSYDR